MAWKDRILNLSLPNKKTSFCAEGEYAKLQKAQKTCLSLLILEENLNFSKSLLHILG
jgi:hypothetical protein